MNVIVTGFGSFLKNDTNPTKEILSLLPDTIKGHMIRKLILPVVFDDCFDVLKPVIDELKPDVIILLGLAAGRNAITPERIAVNLKDSKYPDNQNQIKTDEVIEESGPVAYYSTLPIRKIESILTRKHLPVSISNTAGLYVCNNIMYHTLHYINQQNMNTKAGFIHIPLASDFVSDDETRFNMPLYDILEGIIDSIKTTL